MRIDSSGNLLVGTTDTDPAASSTETGVALKSGGFVSISRFDSAATVNINKIGHDGSLVDFRKEGSTVGSIGTSGGDLYIGTGDTALRFFDGSDFVYPVSTVTGTSRDNAIDLGYSTGRFKDLYLSGGVYLGGTGAANKLDDYEEGTWTPAVSSGTHSLSHASYTKIGNIVYISMEIVLSGTRNANGFSVSGLPFQVANWASAVCYAQHYIYAGTYQLTTAYQASSSQLVFNAGNSTAIGTDFNNGFLNVSGFYTTTA